MFTLDDRTGNVVTTVALFLIASSALYLARGAVFVWLLLLLFTYLLVPAVALVQRHLQPGKNDHTRAIVLVYQIGTLGSYPGLSVRAARCSAIKNLHAALPQILQDLSSGKAAAGLETKHGFSVVDQQRLHGRQRGTV